MRTWRRVAQASALFGYRHRYRRWVLDSLRYITAQDLATGGDHIPELDDVYVDVALVSRAAQQALIPPSGQAADDQVRYSIGELLDRRQAAALALVGQPGSGKSTLLAHAARRAARGITLGRGGRRRLPVLLALRDHAASIVADPPISLPSVIRAEVAGAAGREPHDWWERQLAAGRCLVLLDGLDEVASADARLVVADWVERQIAAYPDNHFVVTSRSYGLPSTLIAQADVLVVRPFTARQVRTFLDRWYLAAERHATGASGRGAQRAVQIRAAESAARLRSLLRDNPSLQDLTFNPLLLTMTATAHRYRGVLPGSRADLYSEICRVLLSRRVQARDKPELLPWTAKQALLAALAYQMTVDHDSEVAGDRVLEILGPQLKRFPSSVTGEAFLDDVARTGLLVEASPGRYAFTHLTFQEYLAARHVAVTPELVETLADNVGDPWWHESILLYAAAADASPIVRACLDDGTIPALTLAFDCDDASAEIDPDLRRRLEHERGRAYEPGCPPSHRRLIAGVEAARLVRHTRTTDAGTRICSVPVPADLYWLFLADTAAPQPDVPAVPGTDEPAIGVWGAEAQALVRWLNSIAADSDGTEVTLPRRDDLQAEALADAQDWQLPPAVTSAWTQPGPELWVRPGIPDPHMLSGAEIGQAIAADARNTPMLPQILSSAVLDVALGIGRDLDDIRALSDALAGDLAVRASSEGQIVDLMHAHAHAIVHAYRHALELAGTDAITRTCATDPRLIEALDLSVARALADVIADDLVGAIELAQVRAVELAYAIDLDLDLLSAFDFDVAHAFDLARVHVADLERARVVVRAVPAAADLDGVFGPGAAQALGPALPVPAVLGLPLRWVASGPLAWTLLDVLAATRSASAGAPSLSRDPYLDFALALSSRAGVHQAATLRADLGGPLTEALRELTAAESAKGDDAANWNLLTGLRRLTEASIPVFVLHQPPSQAEAAGLRAIAVALADQASPGGGTAAETLRTVAATVTLVERRANGESPAGESVILALV